MKKVIDAPLSTLEILYNVCKDSDEIITKHNTELLKTISLEDAVAAINHYTVTIDFPLWPAEILVALKMYRALIGQMILPQIKEILDARKAALRNSSSPSGIETSTPETDVAE